MYVCMYRPYNFQWYETLARLTERAKAWWLLNMVYNIKICDKDRRYSCSFLALLELQLAYTTLRRYKIC